MGELLQALRALADGVRGPQVHELIDAAEVELGQLLNVPVPVLPLPGRLPGKSS